MKVFISQPTPNKDTIIEFEKERNDVINLISEKYNDEIEFLNTNYKEVPVEVSPMWFLGKSLVLLSQADLAVFAKDWKSSRKCRMEEMACREYNIPILYR